MKFCIREDKECSHLVDGVSCAQDHFGCSFKLIIPIVNVISEEEIIEHFSDMVLDDLTEAENNLYINGRIDGAKWLLTKLTK